MNAIRAVAVTVFLSLVCVSNLSGQDNSAANPAVNPAQAPPYSWSCAPGNPVREGDRPPEVRGGYDTDLQSY